MIHGMRFCREFVTITTAVFLLIFTGVPGAEAQGHKIELTVRGLSNDTLILGEYFTSRMIPKDTLVLDSRGRGTFQGEEPYTGGLYLIYYSPGLYFDFLLGDDQELAIEADTSDLNRSLKFQGSENNTIFQEYKNYLREKREELNRNNGLLATASNRADTIRVREVQEEINRQMEGYMDRIESEHSDLFVSEFIGATREPFPPEELLTGDRRHDDSLRFFYYREHYFDRFDPFNIRLLRTPIYEGKIKNYLTRAVPQHPDSLIVAVDYLLQGSKEQPELYRYMLITLFNHFAESKFMGMDLVYFHIAEHYYIPDATWSNPDFISQLKENLENNKPTLIGQTAPNLMMRRIPSEHFQMADQDTAIKRDPHIGQDFLLHDINTPFTILYFWEADCGHCKKSTPALYEVYNNLKNKGLEVVSVHVINSVEGKEKWIDFVNEHHLYDWINCWSPYSNEFRKAYNLQSYPQLFLLDEDKEIVAKRITPEQAESIINNLLRAQSKETS